MKLRWIKHLGDSEKKAQQRHEANRQTNMPAKRSNLQRSERNLGNSS